MRKEILEITRTEQYADSNLVPVQIGVQPKSKGKDKDGTQHCFWSFRCCEPCVRVLSFPPVRLLSVSQRHKPGNTDGVAGFFVRFFSGRIGLFHEKCFFQWFQAWRQTSTDEGTPGKKPSPSELCMSAKAAHSGPDYPRMWSSNQCPHEGHDA